MNRVHVLEFEDLPWFPTWLRADMTKLIVVFARVLGVPKVLGHRMAAVLQLHGLRSVVDLGSGAGGVMPEVLGQIRQEPGLHEVELTLTDLYPNADAIALFASGAAPGVSYRDAPVDASAVHDLPAGLKTMTNAFHHLRPEQARAVLLAAQDRGEPLLVYELAERKLGFVPWLVFLPVGFAIVFLMALVLTPMVRPLTLRQLALTYLVPVIPLFFAWDGQASFPRTYSAGDLDELLGQLRDDPAYGWEHGPCTGPDGKAVGYYLLGEPRAGAAEA